MGISTSTKPKKVGTLNKGQQAGLDQILGVFGQLGPDQLQALASQLNPQQQEQFFQQAVGDPARKNFSQNTIPQILEASSALGAKGGSSITGQLAQAGTQLESDLASQLAQFQVGQQQAGLQNLLGVQSLGLGTQPFALQQPGLSPFVQFILGLVGSTAQGVGAADGASGGGAAGASGGGAAAASSKNYKINIEDYQDSLSKIRKMNVKKYDYKEDFGGRKGCVGLIQEECPEEIKLEQNGLKMVDVYGLTSMLVKAVQDLTEKVEHLEKKYGTSAECA